jgi:hypothetical protein
VKSNFRLAVLSGRIFNLLGNKQPNRRPWDLALVVISVLIFSYAELAAADGPSSNPNRWGQVKSWSGTFTLRLRQREGQFTGAVSTTVQQSSTGSFRGEQDANLFYTLLKGSADVNLNTEIHLLCDGNVREDVTKFMGHGQLPVTGELLIDPVSGTYLIGKILLHEVLNGVITHQACNGENGTATSPILTNPFEEVIRYSLPASGLTLSGSSQIQSCPI